MGFCIDNIRVIPTIDQKMCIKSLNAVIQSDLMNQNLPFLIVATVGTTNSGVVDPLIEISQIAKKHELWMHVDASYGGFFVMTDILKELVSPISKANSIVIDPHKGLFLSYGVGAALVQEGNLLKEAFRSPYSDYLQDTKGSEIQSPSDYSLELTRHNRALRIKLTLDYFGEERIKSALAEKYFLAQYFYQELCEIKEIALLQRPELSTVVFRFSTNTKSHNALNIINSSDSYISSTLIDSEFWLRACFLSFRTHKKHVDKLISAIKDGVNKLC